MVQSLLPLPITGNHKMNSKIKHQASEEQPQLLAMEPNDKISFVGPFDKAVTSFLILRNTSEIKVILSRRGNWTITYLQVCFKIKTTAKSVYLVKPCSGLLDPGHQMQVSGTVPGSFHFTVKHPCSDCEAFRAPSALHFPKPPVHGAIRPGPGGQHRPGSSGEQA